MLVCSYGPASLLYLLKSMGCGVKGYGKPWFLHGSSTLYKLLWGYEEMVIAASLDPQCFRLFLVVCSLLTCWVKTLALLQSFSGFGRDCKFCFCLNLCV